MTEIKSTNIKWHRGIIKREDREISYHHKSCCVWITGLSGSGKSTIARELEKLLFDHNVKCYVLDGDNIRYGLNANLGFSPEDRTENIRRIGEISKLFVDAGVLVISAFISPYKKDRDKIREIMSPDDFIEVYLSTSLEACEKRDPKGLYKKARQGEIKDFTGISAPYEIPQNPEVEIDSEKDSAEVCARKIYDYLVSKNIVPKI